MTYRELAALRLDNLGIGGFKGKAADCGERVETLVGALGAVQAQDYPGTLWALGLRAPGSTIAEVESAVEKARIVRTWPMRGTLHFVAASDLRWMTKLLTPRVIAGTKSRQAQLELDARQFAQSQEIMRRLLSGSRVLSREALLAGVEEEGISTAGGRGYHLLFRAAMEGVICVGPTRDKEQTFALLDDWVPAVVDRGHVGEQAVAELARRYFKSHGPATAKDFAGWTGLSMGETKRGIAAIRSDLESTNIDGIEYLWFPRDSALRSETRTIRVDLLPGFDEFILGYKNRDAVLDPAYSQRICPGGNGVFASTIVINGFVRGTWKRTILKNRVKVALFPFQTLSAKELLCAEEAAAAYGSFLGMEAEVFAGE
ncbi:MAG: winged helix DNA-binding domain-containing protein [Treponemataceae bacterium]